MAEAIRKRSWSGAVLVALLAAGALGVGWSELRDRSAGGKESAVALRYAGTVRAPEFPEDIPWLNTDRPLSLAELRGRFVLLDFWTYCCINCMHILPELKQLEHAWPDALVVIGVHSAKFSGEQETDNIRQAIARYQIEHPVVNDARFRVWSAYAVNAWPTLVLIDPEGRIVGTNSGEITFEQFNPIIAEAVAEAERAGTLKRSRPTWQRAPGAAAGGVLAYPGKVLADGPGGRLFIADSTHHRVLVAGLDGRVTTIIGSGRPGLADGPLATAAFRNPQGLALVGGTLYVADTENHALRAVDLKAGTVRTLVGTGRKPSRLNLSGRGTDVSLHSPWDVLFHDGLLYVANAGSHQLWTVVPSTAEARPYAGSGREDLGDGPRYVSALGAAGVDLARTAKLAQPSGLSTDGRRLYFADSETSALRSVGFGDQATVTTHLGQGLFEFGDVDGARDKARLQHPLGVACVDGVVYLADTYNNKLKRFDPATGRVTTFAGTGAAGQADGPAGQATFDEPGGLSQAGGKLYVADTGNGAIRVVDLATGAVTTLAVRLPEAVPADAIWLAAPPVTVARGDGRLLIELTAGHGWKLNEEGPAAITLTATPAGVVKAAAATRFEHAARRLVVPATLAPGRTRLEVTVDLYVCEDPGGACLPQTVRWRVPVTVTAQPGGGDVPLRAELRPPAG